MRTRGQQVSGYHHCKELAQYLYGSVKSAMNVGWAVPCIDSKSLILQRTQSTRVEHGYTKGWTT